MTLTATPSYGSAIALTMTMTGLTTDAALLAGRESAAAINTTDLAVDSVVGGFVTTGTSPTTAKQIEVWLAGSYDGTSYSGGATGADANLSPQEKSLLKLLTIIPTIATSNKKYTWGPFSVAQAFGGTVPNKWSVFIVHNTGVTLNATGSNHEVKYVPVKYASA